MVKIGTKQLALLLAIHYLQDRDKKMPSTVAVMEFFDEDEGAYNKTAGSISYLREKDLVIDRRVGREVRWSVSTLGKKHINSLMAAAKGVDTLAQELFNQG